MNLTSILINEDCTTYTNKDNACIYTSFSQKVANTIPISLTLVTLTETKSYIPITGCVLEYILATSDLTNHEKLYYLLADSLAHINGKNATQQRSIALSSCNWAKRLNCSKTEIFHLQKSLQEKGYFVIARDKSKFGKNQRNIITPTVPDEVFTNLAKTPDRFSLKHDNSSCSTVKFEKDMDYDGNMPSAKRDYLDKSKPFIRLNYQLLLLIISDSLLSSFAKVLWLGFYVKAYKSYMKKKNQGRVDSGNRRYDDNIPFSFFSTYKELEILYSCSKSSLSKAIKELGQGGFLHKVHSYVKNDNLDDNLHDKSLWHFTLTVPSDGQDILFHENISDSMGVDRASKRNLGYTKDVINETTDQQVISDISKYDPYISRFKPLINKDLKTNIKDLRNLDSDFHFSENVNKSTSDLSEFYKNSFKGLSRGASSLDTQQNILVSDSYTKGKRKEVRAVVVSTQTDKQDIQSVKSFVTSNFVKSLKSFYPLTKEQVDRLNSMAGREYNVNFTNQLLLKLHHIDPNKRFLSMNHMMSYMSKAIRYEKHQGPLVNNENFRFACNLNRQEIEDKAIEKYLKEVEYNIDTSYQSQLRRKIAAQFDPKLAYLMLKEGKFAFSQIEQEKGKLEKEVKKEDQAYVIQLPNSIALTDLQQETLENAIYSVYGNCQIIYEKFPPNKFTKTVTKEGQRSRVGVSQVGGRAKIVNTAATQPLFQSQALCLEEKQLGIEPNSGWYKISTALKEDLGDEAYRAWFSQAIAEERLDKKAWSKGEIALVLYLPSNFMRDMVRQRYGHLIEQYCKTLTNLEFNKSEGIMTRKENCLAGDTT